MRLRQRRNVDFPQPLGPMIAVMWRDSTSRFTFFTASFSPYQTERSRVTKAASAAARAGPFTAAADELGDMAVVIKSGAFSAREQAHDKVHEKGHADKDERAGPG